MSGRIARIAELGRERLAMSKAPGVKPSFPKPLTRPGVAKYILPGLYYTLTNIAKVEVVALGANGAPAAATAPVAAEPTATVMPAPTPAAAAIDEKKSVRLLHQYASAKKTSLLTKLGIGVAFVLPPALLFIPTVNGLGHALINLLLSPAAEAALGWLTIGITLFPGLAFTLIALGLKGRAVSRLERQLSGAGSRIELAQIAVREKIEPKFLARKIKVIKDAYSEIETIHQRQGLNLTNPTQATLDAASQNLARLKQIVADLPLKTTEILQAEDEITFLKRNIPYMQTAVTKQAGSAADPINRYQNYEGFSIRDVLQALYSADPAKRAAVLDGVLLGTIEVQPEEEAAVMGRLSDLMDSHAPDESALATDVMEYLADLSASRNRTV